MDSVHDVDGLHKFALEDIPKDDLQIEYENRSVLDSSFRGGFWKYTSLRFFYLYNYCALKNLNDIFHIEYDNMIYFDFSTKLEAFRTKPMWAVFDNTKRGIPSFVYFKNNSSLHKLLFTLMECGVRGSNDMIALGEHRLKHIDDVGCLPIIANYIDAIDPIYSNQVDLFGVLFDGAAVGQYVGGVDPRNIPGDTCGFVNDDTVFKCNKAVVEWRDCDGLQKPFLNGFNLVNLHIHSKDLSRWQSHKMITGEQIEELCDVYCGIDEDFRYNPRISTQVAKHKNIQHTPHMWDNPVYIFCYGHRLVDFIKWLPFIQNMFVLVTHNSDENIKGSYSEVLYHSKLICWHAQNAMYNHPKLHCIPIGVANSMWPHGDLSMFKTIRDMNIPKTRDFYFYFNIHTNSVERNACREAITQKGLTFGNSVGFNEYLRDLAAYKFAVCPVGNGVDSHRLWECLYLDVIPVIARNEFTVKFAERFPCVLLDKWTDFDHGVLATYKRPALSHILTMSEIRSSIYGNKKFF